MGSSMADESLQCDNYVPVQIYGPADGDQCLWLGDLEVDYAN